MKKIRNTVLALSLFTLVGCGVKVEPVKDNPDTSTEGDSAEAKSSATLRFSAIPDENSTELKAKYDKVAVYLSGKLDVPVEFVPTKDYGAAVEEFVNGNIHLAWFGGLTGVQARHLVPGANAIAQGVEDPAYYSYFIAHKDSGLTPGEDFPKEVATVPFTFGSEKSTSGRLMPQHFIQQFTGKSLEEFFGDNRPLFSGAHDLTYEWVKTGKVKAGALSYKTYDKLAAKDDSGDVQIIWKTPAYADYNFTAHPELEKMFGEGFTAKLQQTLVDIESADILASFQRASLIPAKNEEFDGIKKIATALGFLE